MKKVSRKNAQLTNQLTNLNKEPQKIWSTHPHVLASVYI